MQRRRKSRRPILERLTPIRVGEFARSKYVGDRPGKYSAPFPWPFMQKLWACRSRLEIEHGKSAPITNSELNGSAAILAAGARRPFVYAGAG
jgi:hypothetical protein